MVEIDWSKCILCQKITEESLTSPGGNVRKGDAGAGYRTLANNILRFHDLQYLLLPIDVQQLEDGDGIAAKFIGNNAKWYKACFNKFNNLKLQCAEKRKSQNNLDCSLSTKFTRSSSGTRCSTTKSLCLFCDDSSGTLRQASTFNIDARIQKCALQLEDKVLLAKLSSGNVISQEVVYHPKCLVALYNKAERASSSTENTHNKISQGIALAQLVEYIEEMRAESVDAIPVFRSAELAQMYATRLQQLGGGGDSSTRVNSTHLKDRILANVPGLQAHKQGRDVMLAFDNDIGQALRNEYDKDFVKQWFF